MFLPISIDIQIIKRRSVDLDWRKNLRKSFVDGRLRLTAIVKWVDNKVLTTIGNFFEILNPRYFSRERELEKGMPKQKVLSAWMVSIYNISKLVFDGCCCVVDCCGSSDSSRTLRQFNQDQKTGKSIANLKLNTRGSFIPQKKQILDTNRVPIQGRLELLYFSFYCLFMILWGKICDVTIIKSAIKWKI